MLSETKGSRSRGQGWPAPHHQASGGHHGCPQLPHTKHPILSSQECPCWQHPAVSLPSRLHCSPEEPHPRTGWYTNKDWAFCMIPKDHSDSRLPWGLTEASVSIAFQFNSFFCVIPLPSLPYKCSSGDHYPYNLLHENVHLRVRFQGNQLKIEHHLNSGCR